jgi:hypothetical protein
LPDGASEIFLASGVKPLNRPEVAAENSRQAQSIFGAFCSLARRRATAKCLTPGIDSDLIRPWTKRQ